MSRLEDPAYHRLCDVLLSRDCKLLLKLLHESESTGLPVDISKYNIEDPIGCIALLACLGFIERRT